MHATLSGASMHSAALSGNVDELYHLIEKGLDVDARDDVGDTPLMLAVGRGHDEAILLLSAHGADLHARNSLGLSAFEYAINYEQPGAAALLHELTTIGDAEEETEVTESGPAASTETDVEAEEVYAGANAEGFEEAPESKQLLLALQQALQPPATPPAPEVQELVQLVGEVPQGSSLRELQVEVRALQSRLLDEQQACRRGAHQTTASGASGTSA
jgi:hypothetical protein